METFIICRACKTETIVESMTVKEHLDRKRQIRRRNQRIRRGTKR